ncbi:MAG: hypothetical protein WCO00_11085 [Rhodospirillaceae bacterium]
MQRNLQRHPDSRRAQPTAADASAASVITDPEIAALLAPTRVVPLYSDHGFEGCREVWEPRAVPIDVVPTLRAHQDALEAVLIPADRGCLLARIHALLSHYRAEALPAVVEEAIAADWADDLGDYPAWVVEEACRAWRRDARRYRFRPLPGDIRRLCDEIAAVPLEMRRRLTVLLERSAPPRRPTSLSRADDIRSRVLALADARRMR